MAELKNIRIAVSGIYDYAFEELPTLRIALPGRGAPDWVEEKRLYKVYRPASVLAAACSKFSNLPLTHHHPKSPVDGVNFRDLAIGWTGEHPEVDYIADTNEVGIKSTCVLYDDEALNAYENGEVQLSPGYIAVFEWKKGTDPKGNEYDIVMKEITDVNHVALLPAGRGGEYAVVMDKAAKVSNVFDIAKARREVLDYGTVFDIARSLTEDVTFEEGHVSKRKDGEYIKENGSWRKLSREEKNAREDEEIKRQETEAGKIEKALKENGYDAEIVKSRQDWGNSTYITPKRNGEYLYWNTEGLGRKKGALVKFRLSDHPYTNFAGRSEIMIKNADSIIRGLDKMKNVTLTYSEAAKQAEKKSNSEESKKEKAWKSMERLLDLQNRNIPLNEAGKKEIEEEFYKYYTPAQVETIKRSLAHRTT